MNDEADWKEPEDGVTLGPEEILHREIEKSKTLKVERLKLQGEIEKLRAQNARLTQENRALAEEIKNPRPTLQKDTASTQPQSFPPLPPGWSLFLLIFNSCALAILLYFLIQK